MIKHFAEDGNYWTTTVHPASSQGEITALLEDFGATKLIVISGQAQGLLAWVIRFEFEGRAYRFLFQPLPCRWPDKLYTFAGKRRKAEDQARYQMGRRAFYYVKAILTAACDNQDVLFGFLELPGVPGKRGLPATAAEVGVDKLVAALPDIDLPDVYLLEG